MCAEAVKNQRARVVIDGYTAEGLGVGRLDNGMAVFVPGTARGDVLTIRLVQVRKHFAYGRIEEILTPSSARIPVDCPQFPRCGGCDFRHLTYEEELDLKARRVQDALVRLGGIDAPLPEIVPSPRVLRYRNKCQLPVGRDERGHTAAGFYRARSHQLVPAEDCLLQSEESCALTRAVCRWADAHRVPLYDEASRTGALRHIYIREGSGGRHLTLVSALPTLPAEEALVTALRETDPGLCGVVLNCNPNPGNRVLGPDCRTVWGAGRLEDTLLGRTFALSPLSFYQVNHDQTEHLYRQICAWADLGPGTRALDLYCGVGTITLALAGVCESVTGVEIVAPAIQDAQANAARNAVSNVRFFCADAGQAAQRLAAEGYAPDVVVVDPPRKGIDAAAIDAICRMAPRKLIYIACDPASLGRDARLLREAGGWTLEAVRAFDLFPRTANVETAALFSCPLD